MASPVTIRLPDKGFSAGGTSLANPRMMHRNQQILRIACLLTSLILLVGLGCGKSGGSSDVAGEWVFSEDGATDACAFGDFEGVTYTAEIRESGMLTIRTPRATFTGTRDGNELRWSGQYWDDALDGFIELDGVVAEISRDREQIEGSTTWSLRQTALGPVVCTGALSFEARRAPTEFPMAPANLTAVPLSSSVIRLSWSDRSDDEEFVDVYYVQEPTAPAGPNRIGRVPADTLTFEIGNLAPERLYRFYVRAVNAAGESAPSNTASTRTEPLPPPPAPADVEAIPLYRTSVRLTWSQASEDTISYHVYRGPDATSADSLIDVVDGDTLLYFDGRLDEDTVYAYRVSAIGPGGESVPSDAVVVETLVDIDGSWRLDVDFTPSSGCGYVPPLRGESVEVIRSSYDRFIVSGGRVFDVGGALASNEVLLLSGDLSPAIAVVFPAMPLYISSDVRLITGQGVGTSSGPGGTCQGALTLRFSSKLEPPAPSGLVASAPGSDRVVLVWTDESSAEDEFVVARRRAGGDWEEVASLPRETESYEDTAVLPSTTYEYEVFAENQSGRSEASNRVSVQTPAATRTFAVRWSASPPEGGLVQLVPQPPYEAGTRVELRAIPNNGFSFDGWTGDASGSANPTTVTVNRDLDVVVNFSAPLTYTLEVQRTGGGGGSVLSLDDESEIDCGSTCMQVLPRGTSIELEAAADPGSSFEAWTGCDSVEEDRCLLELDDDRTVFAVFTGGFPTGGVEITGLPSSSSTGSFTLEWTASGLSGPAFRIDESDTTDFEAATTYFCRQTGGDTGCRYGVSPGRFDFSGKDDGTWCYRVAKIITVGIEVRSNVECITVASPAAPILTLRNDSRYDVVSIRLNGQEQIDYPYLLTVGSEYDFVFESGGSVEVEVATGFWDDLIGLPERVAYFTYAETTSVTPGSVTDLRIQPITIGELLTQFQPSANWNGIFYDANLTNYYSRLVFSIGGGWNWQVSQPGCYQLASCSFQSIGSGPVQLLDWPIRGTGATFRTCPSCDPSTIYVPFGGFFGHSAPTGSFTPTMEFSRE